MLLVQKPLTLTPSQSPLYAHRRHPSAPSTVVVHSTRTPGLLTLSKPPRPPLQRQSQRQTPKRLPNSKSAPGIRATLLNSAEITDSKTSVIALPTTPSPQPRGRGQIKHPKDKVQVQRWSFFFLYFCHSGLTIAQESIPAFWAWKMWTSTFSPHPATTIISFWPFPRQRFVPLMQSLLSNFTKP